MRILVTGSARAIGAATAAELTRRGHHVIATARDASLLDQVDAAQRLALDVTDDASIDAALAEAGEVDAVVNNAAVSGAGPLEDYPLDRLAAMFETNTFGALRLVQRLVPGWRDRGHGVIVNVSSVQGQVSSPLEGAYCATEARARGHQRDAPLRAAALRHPHGDHPAGLHRAGHEGRPEARRAGHLRRALAAVGGHRRQGHRTFRSTGSRARRGGRSATPSSRPTRPCGCRSAPTPR